MNERMMIALSMIDQLKRVRFQLKVVHAGEPFSKDVFPTFFEDR
jgi:hypothetical protein